jgi:hypothetical protein
LPKDHPGAAALRGKAKGFDEAVDAINAILAGNPLPLVKPRQVGSRRARIRFRRRVELGSDTFEEANRAGV